MPQKKIISDMVATKKNNIMTKDNSDNAGEPKSDSLQQKIESGQTTRQSQPVENTQSIDDKTKNKPSNPSSKTQANGNSNESKPTFSEWRSRRTPIESSPLFEKMKQRKHEKRLEGEIYERRSHASLKYAGIGALLIILFSGAGMFAYGMFFHTALIEIDIKQESVTLQEVSYKAALKGVPPSEAETPTLFYEKMTLTAEESVTLPATGEEKVEKKASGKIVIYNGYSDAVQKLVKNTRFESPQGKIYRISESVSIPGMKGSEPGSLEVIVYADLPGEEYNIDLVDFTIPGFKGSPQYEKFYARSKTPMVGGFSGIMKTVSENDKKSAKQELENKIGQKLHDLAHIQKPDSTVLYNDNIFTSFAEPTQVPGTGGETMVTLKMVGIAEVLLFDEGNLARSIAVQKLVLAPNEEIVVENINDLTYTLQGRDKIVPSQVSLISFTLSGVAKIVWEVQTSLLQKKLAGNSKKDHRDVFSEFGGIKSAKATLKPFWKTTFPADYEKIKIQISE